jgi:deoxyribonuclease V
LRDHLASLLEHWPREEKAALDAQQILSKEVVRHDTGEAIRFVAGVDVAYTLDESQVFSAVVVFDAESQTLVASATANRPVEFPYLPGLFAFRELPAILEALDAVPIKPDLILCDAQGVAHPRRFGLASHLGVLADVATIGAAKSRLIGTCKEPAMTRGCYADLMDGDEVIGRVLRTRNEVKPIYVSIGHRVSIERACDWVLKFTTRYRLPETTREADALVNECRSQACKTA